MPQVKKAEKGEALQGQVSIRPEANRRRTITLEQLSAFALTTPDPPIPTQLPIETITKPLRILSIYSNATKRLVILDQAAAITLIIQEEMDRLISAPTLPGTMKNMEICSNRISQSGLNMCLRPYSASCANSTRYIFKNVNNSSTNFIEMSSSRTRSESLCVYSTLNSCNETNSTWKTVLNRIMIMVEGSRT